MSGLSHDRGLPHAHIIVIVRPEDRPDTPEKLDRLIYAEIPDPAKDPALYQAVVKHMLHGPHNGKMLCEQDGYNEDNTCNKHFPKAFKNTTEIVPGEYAILRRRRTGRTVVKNNALLDNRWVVPYNPDLMVSDCHCNVEYVNSLNSMKYLFKYLVKEEVRHNNMVVVIFHSLNRFIRN